MGSLMRPLRIRLRVAIQTKVHNFFWLVVVKAPDCKLIVDALKAA